MSDDALLDLARRAGLAPRWKDAFGTPHDVGVETLRTVLAALDLPAGSARQIEESAAALDAQRSSILPLLTATVGERVPIARAAAPFRLVLEDGDIVEGRAADAEHGSLLPAIDRPGYHRLEWDGGTATIAVAPRRCYSFADAAGSDRRGWGIAVQLYGLRAATGGSGLGGFAELGPLAAAAARRGADAIAISPVHAQFSADIHRFSPYAPSSRVAFNVLHADGRPYVEDPPSEAERALEAAALIDWPQATTLRLARLRRAYDRAMADPAARAALQAFRDETGAAIETHARFEALHAHHFGRDPGQWHWRSWPDAFRDPDGAAVASFAAEHAEEVRFHAFLQFLADRAMADAQRTARDAGMAVGLIADLAVGTDAGGSHCWSRQQEMLPDLSIGAPPDLLSRDGQDWGLSAFSPRGLRLNGFTAFIDMLRMSLRHAGGVRIDHGMGLARLWVLPQGARASDGVYLHFPVDDLLRLVALESTRNRGIVLAEDLGTLPDGFQEKLIATGILGMRVMWFERTEGGDFTPPRTWSKEAVAMTSTHDLATVAGWWEGRDLDWRTRLDLVRDAAQDRADRDRDRALLWKAFVASGSAVDPAPPVEGRHAAGAAAGHVGGSACALALLPIEDALALPEQPNLPGTLHEHPNWRRRLPASGEQLLDDPDVAGRLATLDRARKQTA